MSDANRSLMRGLARIAAWQIATAVGLGFVGYALSPGLGDGRGQQPLYAGLMIVLVAMLIGFVPLRVLLRGGPEYIVTAWIAAMILRMFASLIGLLVAIAVYRIDAGMTAIFVCVSYLLLLAVETVGMMRLMRREFDRRSAKPNSELGA